MFMMASLMAGKAAMGLLCAPPRGSGMIASITPKLTSSGAVIFRASVACATPPELGAGAQRMGICREGQGRMLGMLTDRGHTKLKPSLWIATRRQQPSMPSAHQLTKFLQSPAWAPGCKLGTTAHSKVNLP